MSWINTPIDVLPISKSQELTALLEFLDAIKKATEKEFTKLCIPEDSEGMQQCISATTKKYTQ